MCWMPLVLQMGSGVVLIPFSAPSSGSAQRPSLLLSWTHGLDHNPQAFSSQSSRKFPETPRHYLTSGKLPLSWAVSFFNAKPELPSPLGTLRRIPFMPRLGVVCQLLIQQLLILAVKPGAVDNPLEQECPKILSEKRRKMGQEKGIQTKRLSSCFLSSSLPSRVEESKKGFKQCAKH